MNLTKGLFIFLFLGIICCNPLIVQAQYVNMEVTWQEFLSNKKASNTSELVKPSKTETSNYIKYCLIYANTYFCANNISGVEGMVKEIESLGKDVWDKIQGFDDRYKTLQTKIQAYKDLDPLWKKFLKDKNSVTRSDVEAFPEAKNVCERGTLCKYFYMISYDYFCDKDLKNAREVFDARVKKLLSSTFNPRNFEGLGDEVERMDKFWIAMDEMTPAWDAFVKTGTAKAMSKEMPIMDCYVIPNIQQSLLIAFNDICGKGEAMYKKIKELEAKSADPVPSEITKYIEDLNVQVGNMTERIANLEAAWSFFLKEDKVSEELKYESIYPCDREREVKAFLLDGFSNPCLSGKYALEQIAKVREKYKPKLSEVTLAQLKKLESKPVNESERIAVLNKAWADFVPDDKLSGAIKFEFEYCDKIAECKAYIIDGTINYCSKGKKRLDDIHMLQENYLLTLNKEVQKKLDWLEEQVANDAPNRKDVEETWEYFTSVKNLKKIELEKIVMAETHCDPILQTKVWVIAGLLIDCNLGKDYSDKVQQLKKKHDLSYDKELDKQVDKLQKQTDKCK